MRSIETHNLITIKKAIERNPSLAKALKLDGLSFDKDLESFALITGLNEVYLRQNLQQLRNWID